MTPRVCGIYEEKEKEDCVYLDLVLDDEGRTCLVLVNEDGSVRHWVVRFEHSGTLYRFDGLSKDCGLQVDNTGRVVVI